MSTGIAVPGTSVPSGAEVSPGGAQGIGGSTAWTTTLANFTVPPIGQNVTVTVQDTSWVAVGEFVWVATAGGGSNAMALQVTAKTAGSLTLLNPVTQGALISGDSGNLATSGSDGLVYVPPPRLGGILKYVSATALSFLPFNGAGIIINGVYYTIPSTGVVGLANTSVFVNGTAGQNLAASTVYRVYVFNNAGTLTADFSTTAHATSSTAGNVGTEIKSGDDTRTFVGLIYTNASAQFVDTPANRLVRSWVNRKPIFFSNSFAGSTASTSSVLFFSSSVLCFSDDTVLLSVSGYFTVSTPTSGTVYPYVNGAATGMPNVCTVTTGTYNLPVGTTMFTSGLSEGVSTFGAGGYTNAGTLSFNLLAGGIVG